MSIETAHSLFGFKIHFDEIEPVDTITMRSATWTKLQDEAATRIAYLREHEADTPVHESTTISATHVGPISGADAGTGPVVPVGSLEAPAVTVPNMDDSRPNPLTIGMTPDNTGHLVAAEPMPEPYPTDPVPPEPTENVEHEHVETHNVALHPQEAREQHVLEAMAPETPEHKWLRVEAEAKEHHEG